MNIEKGTKTKNEYFTEVILSASQMNELIQGEHVAVMTSNILIKGPKDFKLPNNSWIPCDSRGSLPERNKQVWLTLSDNRVVSGHLDDDGDWILDIYTPDPNYKVIAWRTVEPYKVNDEEAIDTLTSLIDTLDISKDARTIEALNIAINRLSATPYIIGVFNDALERDPDNIRPDQLRKISLIRDKIGKLLYTDWDERTKSYPISSDYE